MKKKVSLVLSGGGARGIAHIGVIEILEENGYAITSVAGASMGALIGGVYAVGQMESLKKWLYTLDKRKVFSLVDFTFSSQGFIKGDKVLNTMKEFIEDKNIEDLDISFAAVATDLIRKKEVVFSKGSIYDAIRASIAIPTVMTPVKTKNGILVDGGVMNNIPIEHVKRSPDDLLVAVNVNANIPVFKPSATKKETMDNQSKYRKKIKEFYHQLQKIFPDDGEEKLGYFDLIDKTIELMTSRITQHLLEKHTPDILVEISRESCNTFDFYKAEELVETGRHAATKALKSMLKKESG